MKFGILTVQVRRKNSVLAIRPKWAQKVPFRTPLHYPHFSHLHLTHAQDQAAVLWWRLSVYASRECRSDAHTYTHTNAQTHVKAQTRTCHVPSSVLLLCILVSLFPCLAPSFPYKHTHLHTQINTHKQTQTYKHAPSASHHLSSTSVTSPSTHAHARPHHAHRHWHHAWHHSGHHTRHHACTNAECENRGCEQSGVCVQEAV